MMYLDVIYNLKMYMLLGLFFFYFFNSGKLSNWLLIGRYRFFGNFRK